MQQKLFAERVLTNQSLSNFELCNEQVVFLRGFFDEANLLARMQLYKRVETKDVIASTTFLSL